MQRPLSAASTRVLRDGGAPPGEILKLAIKELVMAGTWRRELVRNQVNGGRVGVG